MSELYSFVEGSTIIDLVAIALVFISSFVLIATGIGLLIWAQRKKLFYTLVAIAFFPLIIAVADAVYRMVVFEITYPKSGDRIDQVIWESFRSEVHSDAFIMMALGAAGTAFPLIIGGYGLLFKKNRGTVT